MVKSLIYSASCIFCVYLHKKNKYAICLRDFCALLRGIPYHASLYETLFFVCQKLNTA